MTETCPHLRELDAWFSVALDILAGVPDVRRDVLLLLGGAATPATVARVTLEDCVVVDDHMFVYPTNAPGQALPLTAAFLQAANLSPSCWPVHRDDPAYDEGSVYAAIRAVDAAVVRITDLARVGGPARLRALRMHAWKHELGAHVDVLSRCYGDALPRLLAEACDCAETRTPSPVTRIAIPSPRGILAGMSVG